VAVITPGIASYGGGEVVLEWSEIEVARFTRDPSGPLGVDLMEACARVVLAGARRRALRQTGDMISAMRAEVGSDGLGLYADVISPVQSRKPSSYQQRTGQGFPYAIVHEGKKVRDRRPHRSLRPALRDIRTILAAP